MRILITGGAGCLGSNAAERFLDQGATVTVIDNFSTGRRDALPQHDRLNVIEATIADSAVVERTFADARPECVIHAAAAYRDPDAWDEDVRTNILGTTHIVQASMRHAVDRFVYLQTALCYGRARERPITLHHPLAPTTSYAITKTAAEHYVMMSGLSAVSLRLANIYGPRNYTGPMPAFYKRLKAGEPCTIVKTRRDFIELSDLLRLLDTVITPGGATGCFNVSSGDDCTIQEVFDLMSAAMKIVPAKPPEVIEPGGDDTSTLLLDPSETIAAFDWRAEVGLAEGLEKLVAWYDAHGVGETFTHLRLADRQQEE